MSARHLNSRSSTDISSYCNLNWTLTVTDCAVQIEGAHLVTPVITTLTSFYVSDALHYAPWHLCHSPRANKTCYIYTNEKSGRIFVLKKSTSKYVRIKFLKRINVPNVYISDVINTVILKRKNLSKINIIRFIEKSIFLLHDECMHQMTHLSIMFFPNEDAPHGHNHKST